MFPDRVGRVILDGVVDADLYVSPIWQESIVDTDKIFDSFATYCHDAGNKCALYRKNDNVSDIEERIESVMTQLKENPLSLIDPRARIPVTFSHGELKSLIFSSLYAPTLGFPTLALIINILHEGNEEVLKQIFGTLLYDRPAVCAPPLPAQAYPGDAQSAIMCSDKRYPVSTHICVSSNL